MSLLGMLVGNGAGGSAAAPASLPPVPASTEVAAHTRAKPTGRKPLPDKLPRVDVEVLPPEVQQEGPDAFERIGEEVTETVERRPASLVVVRTREPEVRAPRGATAPPRPRSSRHRRPSCRSSGRSPGRAARRHDRSPMAGPPAAAQARAHLRPRGPRACPLDDLRVARGTRWAGRPLVEAMWADARGAPYLCTDATGVLVQAREQCRRGHFWVLVAPERHVLFAYSPSTTAPPSTACSRATRVTWSPTRTPSSTTCTSAAP